MKIVVLIITAYFALKLSECLKCTYLNDNLLGKAPKIVVRSQASKLERKLLNGEDSYLIIQSVPKFCTRLTRVLTLAKLHLYATQTTLLGRDLFFNYNVKEFVSTFNNITTISSHTFVNVSLEDIDLQSNRLKSIEEEAFKDLKLLYSINLSFNELTCINSKMFLNLPMLDVFMLTGNLLMVLGTHDLDFLRPNDLSSIHLNKNRIEVLQPRSMADLTVASLHLEYNRIIDVEKDVFKNSCIKVIYLQENNKLSNASKRYLNKICGLNEIYFNAGFDPVNQSMVGPRSRKGSVKIILAGVLLLITMVPVVYYVYYKIHK